MVLSLLRDFPQDEECVKMFIASGYIGNIKGATFTIEQLEYEIKYFSGAQPCNSWEYQSIQETLRNLNRLLTLVELD